MIFHDVFPQKRINNSEINRSHRKMKA
jgi:hypothetical protein